MQETWRWFGPLDKITLPEIAQTGVSGIVTALHEIPYGEIWSVEAIKARKALIEEARLGLNWAVVESLPVHEDIKRGSGALDRLFANYRQSLVNLAEAGVRVVCYNFMPLLDWTRTSLRAPLPRGGSALRFDQTEIAAFDVHMLKRDGAEAEYSAETLEKAKLWSENASEADKDQLLNSIMAGLPGAYARYGVAELQEALKAWKGFSAADLFANYKRFLEEVIPTAEAQGIKLCVHPDDPPRPILGLPRIVSTRDHIAAILSAVDSPANGLTLCSGSLGANPENDVPAIAAEFAERVHFVHLRNVKKEPDGSFQEAAHLEGDTDMVALARVIAAESKRRRDIGRDDAHIPWRPDHGHELLSDALRATHPGYPLIGRLRGLSEMRGVFAALS